MVISFQKLTAENKAADVGVSEHCLHMKKGWKQLTFSGAWTLAGILEIGRVDLVRSAVGLLGNNVRTSLCVFEFEVVGCGTTGGLLGSLSVED